MPTYLVNRLDPALDILGTLTQAATSTLGDEPNQYGGAIAGQTGAVANITVFATPLVTLTGLTGMSTQSVGRFLTISGAATGANNGTFLIAEYVSATSVKVVNAAGVAPDANNGAITWTERGSYSLQDDLNFVRTDRRLIKGTTNFYDAVPTYQRPTAVGTNVPANLTNIAAKTTDAKALTVTRKFENAAVAATDTLITITDTGNLPHATATDRTGVPVQDGADAANLSACYVEIINPATEQPLLVLGGGNAGQRIYGFTQAGASTSPNTVEVKFYSIAPGAPISTANAYTWEAGHPTTIDLYYGFRERLDNMSDTALRTTLVNGIVGDASLRQEVENLRDVIDTGLTSTATSLTGLLTNTGSFYVFNNLPDGTPSVVEALNTINAQIGIRDYTGTILTDGQTITASLQALSNAIAGATFVRTVERLTSDINAGTAHTLPGGQSYTVDGTYNGQNLTLFWRGMLRDPGPVVDGNDYDETSTTSFTPYTKIKIGDHVNYYIYA